MKKLISLVFAVCIGMSLSAGTWLETFGTSVEKNSSGYWPYTTDYDGYDHLTDGVAYGGWNATVRYVGSFDSYGPHVFLAASKEAYLTIEGIPGNNNCVLSFDIVGYGSEVNISDVLQFYVNEEEIALGSVSVPTDGFKTVTVPGKFSAEYLNLKWYHTSAVTAQLRIDNVKVTWTDPVATYYLSVSAGAGGSVNNVSGSYSKGTTVNLLATPDEGYEFVEWSDGVTTNPRSVEMTKDITLQAIFEAVAVSDCVYPELDGKKGSEILNILYSKINSHTVLSYSDVRADKAKVDFRSDGTVWDMYSDCVFYSSSYCSSGEYSDCECYNREHSVPKSFWGGSTEEPMYTDLHQILPTDYAANSSRSAWPYGEVDGGSVTWSNNLSKLGYSSSYGTTVFEPADDYKGDIARIYFYMLTCYKDKDFTQGGQGYRVFNYSGSTSTFTSTAKAMFLKWHRNDPVSQKEIDRNNAVAKKQGNRNPFVDAPELAEYIWGNKTSTAYSCTSVTAYTITVKANDDSKGYVYGSGTYEKGQTIAISATPYLGYQFEKWDDGNTANPRYVSVTADHTYTAIFSTATPTPVGDPITVQLDPSSTSWSDVGLYAWLTDEYGTLLNSAVLGDWPGTLVSKDAKTGWWSFTFPAAYSDVLHIIWNNADGSEQTIDIDDVTDNTCYQLVDNGEWKYDYTVVDCPTGPTPTPTYEITFVNYDGTVLDSRKWEEGKTPSCSEPSKPDDDYFYCFTGWNPTVVPVTKAATYQAQYRVCGGWITEEQVYWWLESNTLYIIGSGVIPDYAEGAAPWMPYVNEISAVYVDGGITRIGEWAFADMNIVAVQIEEDVTVIGANAFKNSETITEVHYGGYDYQWVAINFVNEYSNPLIYGGILYAKEEKVTTVTVPTTTTEVSTSAFVGMSTVSYEGTVEQWCEMTFTSDYEPSYDLVINGQIVQNPCFGEGLKQINAYAFRGCKSIESICIPASLLQIGADAFKSTPNLNKVLYAGSLAQWCNITFANAEANPSCHADLYISNDKLGNTLDIPSSITTIKAFAFPNTKTLNVYFYIDDPSGYALNSFGTPANVGNKHFYVPCGSKAAYQSKLNYAEELFGEHYIHIYAVLSDNVEQGSVKVLHQPNCDDLELVVKAIANPTYRFVQWSNGSKDEELTLTLSGDITLTAFFELDQFTVRFLMDDGTPLSEQLLTYGQMPEIVPDPVKEATAQYTFTFMGWDKEIKPATANVDYTAVFDATVNNYMVYFIDWNGELLSEQEVPYGSAATEPAVSAREGYKFAGWNVNVTFIVGRTFAVAQYKPLTEGDYAVHYSNNVNNTEIDVENIDLHFPDAPYIEGFVFVGWKPVCDEFITSGMEIQAIYEPSMPSSAEVVVNPANQAQKLIREGNLYILHDGKTYTATGAKVR